MRLALCPLRRTDFGLLGGWLAEPHVQLWWEPRHDEEFLEAKYGPRIDGEEPTEVFVVELDEEPVGLFQWCPAEHYAWWPTELGLAENAVVIDALIGNPAAVGRGVGSALLQHAIPRALERYPDAGRLLASPKARNAASCRVLDKAGFALVHEGELVRDGQPVSRIYSLEREPAVKAEITVDDLTRSDLDSLSWSGNPAHIEAVARALDGVPSGQVEYLAARALSGESLCKLCIDYTRNPGSATFSQLVTRRAWEGRGLAGRVIREAERRALNRGVRHAVMGVESDNERAAAMYARRGYLPWSTEQTGWEWEDEQGARHWHDAEVHLLRKDLV